MEMAIRNETPEPQNNGLVNNFGRSTLGENSVSQDRGIEKSVVDKID